MSQAAAAESMNGEKLREFIAAGKAVIPKNKRHQFATILAMGEGLRTKVNANIATSSACSGVEREIEKLEAAVAAGTDSVMDLSTGPDLQEVREMILERSPVMVGASFAVHGAAAKPSFSGPSGAGAGCCGGSCGCGH